MLTIDAEHGAPEDTCESSYKNTANKYRRAATKFCAIAVYGISCECTKTDKLRREYPGRKKSMSLLVRFGSIRYRTSTLRLSTRSSLWGIMGKSNLEGGFALNMLSALIRAARSYPTMPLVEQLVHQRCVHSGPLVLGIAPLKFPIVHSGYKPNCLTHVTTMRENHWFSLNAPAK